METTRTVKCVLSSEWMRALEKASITIISPTGKSITIYKKHLSFVEEDVELVELVHAIVQSYNGTGNSIVLLTIKQMKMLLEMSKIPYFGYKDKTKSFKQRKFEAIKKESSSRNICCGQSLTIKDHGKWEGYYCKKCGSGGSRNKR